MPLTTAHRPRKALFAAVALLAGGYASFRLYNSSCVTRKREQLARIFKTICLLCEAACQSAETLSLLSNDVHVFLRSEGNDVPRSLKQIFKFGHCAEIQETSTLLSCALTQGLLRGVKREVEDFSMNGRREAYRNDVARKLRKRASFMNSRFDEQREADADEEYERTEGSEMKTRIAKGNLVVHKRICRRRDQQYGESLPERLFDKMFSQAGTGFASAVVGSVARNVVIAFLDGLQMLRDRNEDFMDKVGFLSSKIAVDLMLSDKFRPLIAECIQNFVSTAISVYIDKTKGINIFDEAVAGITNPSYQAPMKELLSVVCKESVETFVKTAHKEIFQQRVLESESVGTHQTDDSLLIESTPMEQDSENFAADRKPCVKDEFMFLKVYGDETDDRMAVKTSGTNVAAVHSNSQSRTWVGGIMNTLTVATNNRKLLVDLVGTMTSEATRSFVEVIVSTVSSFLGLNARKILSHITTWKLQSLLLISVVHQELTSYLKRSMAI